MKWWCYFKMKKQKFKNQNTQKYYHQIDKTFPLHNSHEKEFLKLLKNRLYEYENQKPNASYEDYINHFGLPEDIIIFFYQHYDHHYVITHMKSRKIIKYCSLIIVPLIVLALIYMIFITYQHYQDYKLYMDSIPAYEEEIIYEYDNITIEE